MWPCNTRSWGIFRLLERRDKKERSWNIAFNCDSPLWLKVFSWSKYPTKRLYDNEIIIKAGNEFQIIKIGAKKPSKYKKVPSRSQSTFIIIKRCLKLTCLSHVIFPVIVVGPVHSASFSDFFRWYWAQKREMSMRKWLRVCVRIQQDVSSFLRRLVALFSRYHVTVFIQRGSFRHLPLGRFKVKILKGKN